MAIERLDLSSPEELLGRVFALHCCASKNIQTRQIHFFQLIDAKRAFIQSASAAQDKQVRTFNIYGDIQVENNLPPLMLQATQEDGSPKTDAAGEPVYIGYHHGVCSIVVLIEDITDELINKNNRYPKCQLKPVNKINQLDPSKPEEFSGRIFALHCCSPNDINVWQVHFCQVTSQAGLVEIQFEYNNALRAQILQLKGNIQTGNNLPAAVESVVGDDEKSRFVNRKYGSCQRVVMIEDITNVLDKFPRCRLRPTS